MQANHAMLFLAFALFPAIAAPHGQCVNAAIEPLAKEVAADFAAKRLAALDKERPHRQTIQFVVEHSIADGYQVEQESSFAAIDGWIKGQEAQGFPVRVAPPLQWCKKGLCVFDLSGGVEHNHRYMQKLTYGFDAGCPYVRSVFLLDGD